ncbi:MAG: hypothetical protein ACRDGM_20795 [bacterium]
MNRYTSTVWLRGAYILSAILLGTSMGGASQTASAADDQLSGQTADQTGPIEGQSAEVTPLAEPLGGKSVTHTRIGNYTFAQGTNNLVPLSNTGLLESNPFTTSGRVVVTYTAECAVGAAAGNTTTWLNIDMQLRNVVTGAFINLPPSTPNTADALCTANGTAATDGWVMASITGIATGLPLSDYRVQVRANLQAGVAGNIGWLGDTSLVIRK